MGATTLACKLKDLVIIPELAKFAHPQKNSCQKNNENQRLGTTVLRPRKMATP